MSALNADLTDSCAVCLEPFDSCQKASACSCGHVFHLKCINDWLNCSQAAACPTCKAPQKHPPIPLFLTFDGIEALRGDGSVEKMIEMRKDLAAAREAAHEAQLDANAARDALESRASDIAAAKLRHDRVARKWENEREGFRRQFEEMARKMMEAQAIIEEQSKQVALNEYYTEFLGESPASGIPKLRQQAQLKRVKAHANKDESLVNLQHDLICKLKSQKSALQKKYQTLLEKSHKCDEGSTQMMSNDDSNQDNSGDDNASETVRGHDSSASAKKSSSRSPCESSTVEAAQSQPTVTRDWQEEHDRVDSAERFIFRKRRRQGDICKSTRGDAENKFALNDNDESEDQDDIKFGHVLAKSFLGSPGIKFRNNASSSGSAPMGQGTLGTNQSLRADKRERALATVGLGKRQGFATVLNSKSREDTTRTWQGTQQHEKVDQSRTTTAFDLFIKSQAPYIRRDLWEREKEGAAAWGSSSEKKRAIPAWARSTAPPPTFEDRMRDEALRRWRRLPVSEKNSYEQMAARRKAQQARLAEFAAARSVIFTAN